MKTCLPRTWSGATSCKTSETVWMDGPLTLAVRAGAICYLDEVVEARKDTTVVIHPLTDNRRRLVVDKTGEHVPAHPDFMMVISYNPGYQSVLKDLKQSTRQRFVSLEFDYPETEQEAQIVSREGGRGAGGRPEAGGAGRQDPRHPGAGAGRRRQHPAAHPCRAPDRPGGCRRRRPCGRRSACR